MRYDLGTIKGLMELEFANMVMVRPNDVGKSTLAKM